MTAALRGLGSVGVLLTALVSLPSPAFAEGADARLQLTSTPSAAITLDGRAVGMTPKEDVVVPPGRHRLTFVHRGRSEGRTIEVAAGETRVVDVNFDPPRRVPPTQEAPPPPGASDALDLCALTPRKGDPALQKERAIIFAPSGAHRVNDDARIRAVDGARLVRELFATRLATPRLHNVVGSFAGRSGWEDRESLSLAEVRAFVADVYDVDEARATIEKPHLAHSLECTDYLVVPAITAREAKWQRVKDRSASTLSLEMNGALAIFRRRGEWFERIARFSESVPSPLDPTGEAKTGGFEEQGSVCRRSRAGSTPDVERSRLAVACEVHMRADQLALALRDDTRAADGWHLFGKLAHPHSPPSLTLGREDGVRLGDAFEVRDARNHRIAFFKTVKIGAGGDRGQSDHSLLHARAGAAEAGARVDAYSQLGVVVAPHASVALLAYGDGATTVRIASGAFQDFELPAVVFGGGGTLGFDLSALVGSTETYARIGAGVFVGSGLNTSVVLVPIDLWFEKGFYLMRRLMLTAALGATVQRSSVNVLTALPSIAEDLHLASTMFGPAARLGVDVMLHPDWSLRLEGVLRVPLNRASYTESDNKAIPVEWLARDDHFATLGVNLGVARTF